MKLRTCKDIEQYADRDRSDRHCLNYLTNHYYTTAVAGHGLSGIVIVLLPKQPISEDAKPIVAKITMWSPQSRRELITACLVDERLAKHNPLFTQTFGWLICDKLPEQWIRDIERYKKDLPNPNAIMPVSGDFSNMFIFSQFGGDNLAKKPFTTAYNCKIVIFEVFYALYWAREHGHNFVHNDLHLGNVVVQRQIPALFERSYRINDTLYSIDWPDQVQLIDFDRSNFDGIIMNEYGDEQYFLNSICTFPNYTQDVAYFIKTSVCPFRDRVASLDDVFSDAFFDDLRVAPKRTKVQYSVAHNQWCHACNLPAQFALKTAPQYVFCSENCRNSFGSFIQVL